jgi:hypothetical protein
MGFVRRDAGRWPNGVVPFELRGKFVSSLAKKALALAIREYSKYTAIRLREKRPGDKNWITFTDFWPNNWSENGRKQSPGWQDINISNLIPRINSYGPEYMAKTLIHEIGHAIGLQHEHQRPDRDQYVVEKGFHFDSWNYDIKKDSYYDLPIGDYNCGSIMHYREQLLRAAKGKHGCTRFGRSKPVLSAGDISAVNFLYPVQTRGSVRRWYPGWVASPFQLSNRPHSFWYRPADGTVEISELKPEGERVVWEGKSLFKNNYFSTVISLIASDGTPIILLYERQTGRTLLLAILDGDGLRVLPRQFISNLGQNWTQLQGFMRSGKQHFLAYSKISGQAAFFQISADARSVIKIWKSKWSKQWTNFDFFTIQNTPHLLSYNSSNGTLVHSTINKSSKTNPNKFPNNNPFTNFKKSPNVLAQRWINFGSYEHLGKHYLFAVKRGSEAYVTGGGGFKREDQKMYSAMDKLQVWFLKDGFNWTLIGEVPWSRSWNTFIPYSVVGKPEYLWFLAYNSTSGFAQFGKIYATQKST